MYIESVEVLLLVAALVAIVSRRLRLPYTVGLVIAGAALAVIPSVTAPVLDKDLIYRIFLPPLVFEAALMVDWRQMRGDLPVIGTLATAGVCISAAISAAGMHFGVGWAWSSALVLGTLIAATDPVSVIATFKDAGVHGRIRTLIEAESLLNDGMAATVFTLAVIFAKGEALGPLRVLSELAIGIGGGIAVGLVVTALILQVAGRTADPLVEITLSTAAAYGSFLVADMLGASGVLASLSAGLLVANHGSRRAISVEGRRALESFWSYAAFAVNSLVFLMIGMREVTLSWSGLGWAAGVALVSSLAGRAAAVYPLASLFAGSRYAITRAHQHILAWAGLRGALALALSLGLPKDMPHAAEIVTVAFALVGFSVVFQGLTITPLMKSLGEFDAKAAEPNSRAR